MSYIGQAVVVTFGEFLNDQPPIVPIYYTSPTACADGTVTLSTDPTFLTYQWQYSTNGVSYLGITDADTHTFNVSSLVNGAGYYRVKVTVPYTGGDFYSGPAIVSFYALPAPTVLGTVSACVSTTLSTQNYLSYQWIKDEIDINGATAQTYVATESGNYAVRVTESHGSLVCAGTSIGVPIVIYSPPAVAISGDSSGCDSVDLSTQAYSSYQWLLNGEPILGATAQYYTALETGDYTVAVVDSNGCTATSEAYSVQIFGHPEPPTINLSGSIVSVPDIYSTYQWLLEGDPVEGATSSIYVPTFPGNYSVEITDEHGCSAVSDSVYVVIKAYIVVTPNLIGPPTLEAVWPGQDITDVYWFTNGIATVHTMETLLVPTMAGNYKAVLFASDLTTVTPSVNVTLSYKPWMFEVNVSGSVGNGGAISRYTDIVFEITESQGRVFPVSYINFFVYQNGGLLEALTKDSSYVSYEEIPNGWRFVINGPSISPKYRFKNGSIIEVRAVVAH